jgi:hypothetical protein
MMANFTPDHLKTGKTHWMGGSAGFKASLDILEKRKISWLCQDLNHGSPSPQTSHYANHTTMFLCSVCGS